MAAKDGQSQVSKKQRGCNTEETETASSNSPSVEASSIPEPSSTVPGARQVEEAHGIRLLDEGLQDLFITGRGAPVLCQQSSLFRAHALLTDLEKLEIGEADHVAGSQWPLLLLVTPEGSQPHFVEPGVLARQGVRQHERPSKHPREVED